VVGEFPADVEQFLLQNITSVDQLEVLLLLRSEPATSWSPAAVSRELATQPEAAAQRLADLQALHLVEAVEGPERGYRYAPGTGAQRSAVDRLAQVYRERRVAVITLIYSKPLNQVQAFADAFRLRKGD
jgi:predicted transcriptional regulator